MRKRMSWSWVGDWPVFVYTTWLGHKVFNVDIVIGTKGDQNAGNTGPTVKPDHTYLESRFYSKGQVVDRAFKIAEAVVIPKIETMEEDSIPRGTTHFASLPDNSMLFYKVSDSVLLWLPHSKVWDKPGLVPYTLHLLCRK